MKQGEKDMNRTCISLRCAAAAMVALHSAGLAIGQSHRTIPVSLSYMESPKTNHAMARSFGGDKSQTWIVAIVILAIIIYFWIKTFSFGNSNWGWGRMGFDSRMRPQYSFGGFDLWRSGPLRFGINPLSQLGFADNLNSLKPGIYLSASFRF
jgi:hypothetical protein